MFLDLNLNHPHSGLMLFFSQLLVKLFRKNILKKKYLNFLFQGDHEPGKEPGDIVIQLEEKVNQSNNNSSINQSNKQLIIQLIHKENN